MSNDVKPDYLGEFKAQTLPHQLHAYSRMVDSLESPVQELMQAATRQVVDCRIIHAALGIASESGEIADAVKKLMAYGKPLDLVNLDEEMGDILWYIQLYCNVRKIRIEELMAVNYAKLRTRYGDKFSQEACFNRNLELERQNLEASISTFRVQDSPEDLAPTKLNVVASDKAQINFEQK